jgi:hypothetical protein
MKPVVIKRAEVFINLNLGLVFLRGIKAKITHPFSHHVKVGLFGQGIVVFMVGLAPCLLYMLINTPSDKIVINELPSIVVMNRLERKGQLGLYICTGLLYSALSSIN